MAQKGKSTSKRKPRAKKPKVVLSTRKVYVMTACIFSVCVAALFFSVKLNGGAEKPQESEITAKSEKNPSETISSAEVQKSQKNQTKIRESQKTSKSTAAVAAQTKPSVVPVEQSDSSKKSVSKPAVSVSKSTVPAQNSQPAQSNQQVKPAQNAQSALQAQSNQPATKNQQSQTAPSAQSNQPARSSQPAQVPSPEKASVPDSLKKQNGASSAQSTSAVASAVKPSQNETVQEQLRKHTPFLIPPATNGATIVIIIDDAGRSAANTKRYAQLPFPITIAVLPKLPQTAQCAQVVRNAGKELILHQPMQAENMRLDPGPGAIRAEMNSYEIAATLKENILELGGGVKGLNNHEGSLITADEIKIGAVLEVCAEQNVYFLDSRTTAGTKARQAALERDMTIFEKAGPYIDNDISREKMLERMYETLAYANRHGRAIVIGHVDKSVSILPDLLAEMYPYMRQAGYKFATPSMLK